MSFNHENVVWQREDGRWGIGFYVRITTGQSTWDDDYADHGYDPEWDDEFDYSAFMFARTGFATEQQAINSWNGANPGSHEIMHYSKANAKAIADLEDMVKAANDPAYAKARVERKAKEESRALVKRVRERLRENPPVSGGRYYVRFSMSKLPSATGMMNDKEYWLSQQGDWLGFETETVLKSGKRKPTFLKVWNVKTNSQAPNVLNIDRAVARSSYRY